MNRTSAAIMSQAHAERAAPRATIRPITISDEQEFITRAAQSLEFHERWIVTPKSPLEFQRYLSRFEDSNAVGVVICDSETESIVGFVNLNTIIGEPYFRGLLGYGTFVPYEGRGFMTAGLSAMIEHSFDQLHLHRLEADVQPDNLASMQLVRRLGFRLECISERFIRIKGEWMDHARWALTSDKLE